MKINFMSGTGNSYRAAVWMREIARSKGIESELEQIRSNQKIPETGKKLTSLLGMVYPTYGFTAPWHVIRYALHLPFGKGQHAFVVATRGALMIASAPFPGFEGTAAYLIAFILMLKGYNVRGVTGLDMPANMISVHSGLSEADSRFILNQAREKVNSFINSIFNGKREYRGILALLIGVLLIPVSLIYMLFVRFFLAKLFFGSGNCTGCGLCARSCPKNAIKMIGRKKPRPYWKLTCESCMRCMGYCPNKAIEISHLLAVFLLVLVATPISAYILNGMVNILIVDLKNFFIKAIVSYLWFLFLISSAYLIFSCLIRISLLNKLFTYATFTHYYRRYHEPDTELEDIAGKDPRYLKT